MYVCSCFGITEREVREHADAGACTPRRIASACKAGTDCGGCVRRIQALLGRGAAPGAREAAAIAPSTAAVPSVAPVVLAAAQAVRAAHSARAAEAA
ncbi:bacterioferritin-associated ferredoxin [Streptomyces sp. MNU89]|uniref:(2Fe-2S)-binding protein n=1 Tax=Streptomyces sp. MNU89 TaxID=2560025 RepID=UPI001E4460E3|nr:(2Fe-2S)-binding protein [Streptomyces sp. MNU89]MCC9742045.1 (2Fe-2S)-binding protein [Streptomyces sp. MNU89]